MNLEEESWGADPGPTQIIPDPSYLFYGGTVEVFFDRIAHRYYRFVDGLRQEIPGVTTVLGTVNKPYLKPWIAKVTIEEVKRLLLDESGALKPLTVEEVAAALLEAKSAHKNILHNAGNIGSIAHDALDAEIIKAIAAGDGVVRTRPIVDPNHASNPTEDQLRQAQNCADAAYKWMQDHNVRYIHTERKIYSRLFDFSGTLDGVALVDSCNDSLCKGCRGRVFKDERCVVDYKTSNQLSDEYAWQTGSYEFAYLEEFLDEILTGRWILRLGKEDGAFECWYCSPDTFEADLEAFLSCLDLHRKKNAIEDRRAAENSEWSAVVREGKKAITADNNVARKELYKKLRGEGMSVDEADSESRKQYPVREVKRKPKEEKPEEKPIEQISKYEQGVLQAIEQFKQVTARLPVVEPPVVEAPAPIVEAPAAAPTPKPTGLPTIRRTSRPA
jgi:hypothetical protein